MTSDSEQRTAGGVLSSGSIQRKAAAGLISPLGDDEEDLLQGAGYNLRVGHIITADKYVHLDDEKGYDESGRRREEVLLQPGQMATLASLEQLDLPLTISGLIVPRDSFAKNGLLTLNAGHVDPGHKGFVTAQVVNLTDRPFPLHLQEAYFSIIFFHLDGEAKKRSRNLGGDEARIRKLRSLAAQSPVTLVQKETLEEVFVSYDDLTLELAKRVWIFVLAVAALAGTATGIYVAVT